jgi:hypothetical protein
VRAKGAGDCPGGRVACGSRESDSQIKLVALASGNQAPIATNQERSAGQLVWEPDPLLVGVVHKYVKKLSLLIATELPTVLQFTDDRLGP